MFSPQQKREAALANSDTPRLAVLIDADNASSSVAKEILEEVAKYGTATVKRAYGDWTTQNLVGWKAHLHRHAIQPVQQFAYTQGKNSTDSAFTIDAMDLLYAGNVDGFCLVSSDSDFTRLATRLREAGKIVFGMGERKTPEPFIAACDKFLFFEVLKKPIDVEVPMQQVPDVPDLKNLLSNAVRETVRESGWSRLSTIGSLLGKTHSSFDPRNYGFKKLSELVRAQPYLEVVEKADPTGFVHVEVRLH
ncbi:NYN domain-containing protein [Acidovorax delafieldii]|uniref:NYN domain-containing protein n=1 Tax=Acidovorax delafieldii TaxID=47920 RepID=UPI003F50366E